MVGSAKEIAESLGCRQAERNTCFHDFYYMCVCRGEEVVECTVLREIKLIAWQVSSNRALECRLDELGKQERKTIAELSKRSAELERELEAAEKTSARLKKAARKSSQGTRRRAEERESSVGSGEGLDSNESAKVGSPTREKRR